MPKSKAKQQAPFLVLMAVAIGALFIPSLPNFDDGGKYNGADIAWIIVATALVFLMTPGLAFFYGGMVHRKNVISTMIILRHWPACSRPTVLVNQVILTRSIA